MSRHLSTEELMGSRYGRLTIISDLGITNHHRYVVCKCDCGVTKKLRLNALRMGHSKSCGCLNLEMIKERATKHGLSKHPLFTVWANIRQRCTCTYHKQYIDYGARGIKICEQWNHDFKSFYDWCISNGYKRGLTIDRIDNNGGYGPSNCRIVDQFIQARNKRSNFYIEIKGVVKCLKEWCIEYGLNYKLAHQRIKRDGYSLEEIISKCSKNAAQLPKISA